MQSVLLSRLPWQSLNKDSRQRVCNNGSLMFHNVAQSPPPSGLYGCYQWCFPFPLLQKHKLRTERRRTVRTRTVQISLLLWVWNGAAPVINSHWGVYSSIVLSFSDCLNCLWKNSAECPILTFADPFSIALCCTKMLNVLVLEAFL